MIDRVTVPFAEWAGSRWYTHGALFPTMVAAIVLGVFAALGSWWLWPVVAVAAVPPLVIVFTPTESRPAIDASGWHLRQVR